MAWQHPVKFNSLKIIYGHRQYEVRDDPSEIEELKKKLGVELNIARNFAYVGGRYTTIIAQTFQTYQTPIEASLVLSDGRIWRKSEKYFLNQHLEEDGIHFRTIDDAPLNFSVNFDRFFDNESQE